MVFYANVIKCNDLTEEESIKGELKYVYKDDFSSFEETVPIHVKKEEEVHFELKGVWQIIDYEDDTRTTTATMQITDIDFQNGERGYAIRRYNNGWSSVEDPYNPESRKKMANATDGVSFYVGGGHKANQSFGKPDKKFRERH